MSSIQSRGLDIVLVAIDLVMFLSWIVLRLTVRSYSLLGRTGAAMTVRVMALLIAAIAV